MDAQQHIAFRTDATSQIGTGHFMRCLTLADSLKQRGVQVRFVSRELPAHLRDMLAVKGMELISLDNNNTRALKDNLAHAHWLGVSQAQDAEDSIQALSDKSWDWLVVDHYALDARWESELRATARQVMVIDDIADRQHDCDVLLDQNFYADMQTRYNGKVPAHCRLLLGPHYALLRDEFRQMHEQIKPRSGPVRRLLVFFGGVDGDNYTGRTIEALAAIGLSAIDIDVVIGAQHPCREQITVACKQFGFICHVQTDRMAELMAAADLAIGAGGSATWERCTLGLPTLTFCTADNQKRQIADAAREGFLYAPSFDTNLAVTIKRHTIGLFENNYLRWHISNRAMQAVDGRGVLRVIRSLDCCRLKMRMVNVTDSPKLFEWRNSPNIRSVSRNINPIIWEDHQRWFATVMGSHDRVLLIGQVGDVSIGVVRFDKQEDIAEVSIYLVPDANHSGQGRNLLLSGEQWIKENWSEVKHIRACVIGGNEPSHRLFLGLDYHVEVTNYLKKL